MKIKRLLLSIGTISAGAAPLITISCSEESNIPERPFTPDNFGDLLHEHDKSCYAEGGHLVADETLSIQDFLTRKI